MKYIDSGGRDATQTLGSWMKGIAPSSVAELRFQTGFFGAKGISLLSDVLLELRVHDRLVRALVGSNNLGTARDDVLALMESLGIPRKAASLGVCAFGSGFFHPKVVHIRHVDGRQEAYVGSANLTAPGVGGLHIEAGLLLDTGEGDALQVLNTIAQAIDDWFTLKRDGFFP